MPALPSNRPEYNMDNSITTTDHGDALPETGGIMSEVSEVTALPDGSGFFTASLPLPADHWIYKANEYGGAGEPEFVDLTKYNLNEAQQQMLETDLREAVKYAVRASTMCGKAMDFDPDAILQNFRVAVFGYYSGLEHVQIEGADKGANAATCLGDEAPDAPAAPIEIYCGPHHGIKDDFNDDAAAAEAKPIFHHSV